MAPLNLHEASVAGRASVDGYLMRLINASTSSDRVLSSYLPKAPMTINIKSLFGYHDVSNGCCIYNVLYNYNVVLENLEVAYTL